jgi:pimeloyl-ACP methyl ester carboxylesterase
MARDMVFIHGGRQASWVWAPVLAAMEAQAGRGAVRALALDVPGCGAKRGRVTDGVSLPDVVAELAGEIETAGVSDALIVGHSQAGALMPGLVEAAPTRFRRAVYVACCAPAEGQAVADMMGAGRHGADPDTVGWPVDRETVTPDQLFRAMFCNDMSPEAADAFMGCLGQDDWPIACSLEHRTWRYGAERRAPTTYVAALRDASLPLAWQLRFAERFGAEAVVRIDAGHQVMQTRPHALAEVLLAL